MEGQVATVERFTNHPQTGLTAYRYDLNQVPM